MTERPFTFALLYALPLGVIAALFYFYGNPGLKSIDPVRAQAIGRAVKMASAMLETTHKTLDDPITAEEAADRIVAWGNNVLEVPSEFESELAGNSAPLARSISRRTLPRFVKDDPDGPWEVVVWVDEDSRTVVIDGYGPDLSDPIISEESARFR